MKKKSINQAPSTAANFFYTLAQIGVAALAFSAVGTPAANARPLTRPSTVYDPTGTLPATYTINATERAYCQTQTDALKQQPENFAPYRHTKLTGCRIPVQEDGSCVNPVGRRHEDGSIRLQEAHKKVGIKQRGKPYSNAKTMLAVLSCDQTQKQIQNELKQQKIDYKKNPAIYKQKLGDAILKIIKERQLKIDGVSLIIEDGVAGEEKCMIIDDRRKDHNPPRVVLVLDPTTCKAQGMHPMIKEVYCRELCHEAKRVLFRNEKVDAPGGGSGGTGGA